MSGIINIIIIQFYDVINRLLNINPFINSFSLNEGVNLSTHTDELTLNRTFKQLVHLWFFPNVPGIPFSLPTRTVHYPSGGTDTWAGHIIPLLVVRCPLKLHITYPS